MLLADLFALRDKVEKAINKHVSKQRAHWEGKLAELSGYSSNGTAPKKRGRPPGPTKVDGRKGKRKKAAIKYRGPKPGEKWAGRGLMPRWLTAYIKAGKKKEDFAVGTGAKKAKRQ